MSDVIKPVLHPHHTETQFAGDPVIASLAEASGTRSVDHPEELPESLRYLKDRLPGILFVHSPLGGGDPVPQFRPDKPATDSPKYIFPKGAGSVISITPPMQARLADDNEQSCTVLIVEGTKQALFAAAYAPENVIAVGIQGCWGWSSDGLAVSSLDGLCKGRSVVVALDADVSSNPDVYSAARSLTGSLNAIQAASVKFLEVPGSLKAGLDDFLARRPVDNRAEPLASLIKAATPFAKLRKPPKPAVKRRVSMSGDSFDYVSEELGEVIEGVFESIDDNGMVVREHIDLAVAGEIDGRRVRRVAALLDVAPRIIAMIEEIDDLAPGTEPTLYYEIEIQSGPAESPKFVIVRDVASKDLHKIRSWLDRGGDTGAFASLGPSGVTPSGQARIAEVMRRHAKDDGNVERRTTLLRSGWFQDSTGMYWVDNGGAHGANEKVTHLKAKLEGSLKGINIPGFNENYTLDEARASAQVFLEVVNRLYDPTPWITAVSGIFWSLAGGHPDAVLFFAGEAGSGKTSIMGVLASMFGPSWGTDKAVMATVEGTVAYLSDVTRQIHNCALIIDDARNRSSARAQEAQDEALDAVIRVGYGGGSAARGRKVLDASGNWRQSEASLNRPFVIIAGESLPDSSPQSTIDRCLVVEVKTRTSLKSAEDTTDGISGHNYLVKISQEGALRPFVSWAIREFAERSNRIRAKGDASTSLEDVREGFEKNRVAETDDVLEKLWPQGTEESKRARRVTGTFIAGAGIFVELLNLLGVDDDEVIQIQDDWQRAIVASAVDHAAANLNEESGSKPLIETLRGAVSSGKFWIDAPVAGQTRLGKRVTVRTNDGPVDAVALIPTVVGEILNVRGKIIHRFKDVLIKDNDGQLGRLASINGTSSRCIVIPASLWYGTDNFESADEGPDGEAHN